ncbi:TrbC/VirB2 family protein [Sandarakinorhabdus limnophila]|uniref:TrbC/VirB2 family protein n=1 Tax=Sandarakinorhabdus limnophila TaxID=210512 RepID=UPI000404147B|nr:TrbC/VirB2 family protein [Sandarakinorhabdus limnophila]
MSSQTYARRTMAAMVAAMLATPALGQSVTLDPQGSGPLTAALGWIQGTLLGSVATAVAVIAVASVGLLMLTGRMNWRYGATVVIGLFILFGAGAIVAGIRSVAGGA